MDVLVLYGAYPKKLLNRKLYLAAGVAAAFECKTTLKAAHIDKAVENCTKIKSLYPTRSGTPYKELHAPIVYGLLAHSRVWKGDRSTPPPHLRQMSCGDCATPISGSQPALARGWTYSASRTWRPGRPTAISFLGPNQMDDWSPMAGFYGPNGSASTAYMSHTPYDRQSPDQSTPIGALISYLTQRLAWEDPDLRGLADYYRVVDMAGPGGGPIRFWPSTIYSSPVRDRLEASHQPTGEPWNEWALTFPS